MSRQAALAGPWDLVVIGGGITGAGILLEAARRGVRMLLVEQRDFAWGTSSRSSKLVHGGLRYLKEGQFGLTRESVHEREHLLQQAAGLVEPQSFAFGDYAGRKPGKRAFLVGLAIYDRMAGQHGRHYFERDEFVAMAPNVATEGLQGGMVYTDAKTDDARLVLRVLQEARQHGGVAVNYMAVESLLQKEGDVCGVRLRDGLSGEQHEVRARLVISATGAWADRLRAPAAGGAHASAEGGAGAARRSSGTGRDASGASGASGATAGHRLRPLRGSHLVLPAWRLPLAQAISLMHPADGRPVFAYPWEGVTLVGTTDVDHADDLSREAAITRAECDYLMAALHAQFPQLNLTDDDIIATYAGVRPVIDSGKADPSKETRDHALWLEHGLLTVTGGKLTTFRVIALDALKLAATRLQELPAMRGPLTPQPVFAPSPPLRYTAGLPPGQAARLQGRYGAAAQALVDAAQPGELENIPGTETIWAQLRWAARKEDVCKLEDLLLRRTRIGIQLRGGGIDILPRIRSICQPELGWSDERWAEEHHAYMALWAAHYNLPK